MNKNLKRFAVIIAVIAILCIATSCIKPVECLDTTLFWQSPSVSQVVYVVNTSGISALEVEMLASLQGIVAKTSSQIYLINSQEDDAWLESLEKDYNVLLEYVSDPWALVEMFKPYLNSNGYVLYTSTHEAGALPQGQSINYATTVAGADRYLMISESLEAKAQEHGLSLKKDVRSYNTEMIFNEYRDRLNKAILIHQEPTKWTLRDYSIAAGALCYYTDYYDGSSSSTRDNILVWADECAPILGWTENEVNFVSANSLRSKITVAADWSANLSLYSGLKGTSKFENKDNDKVKAENKHYVAIVMSDGDNLQWMQNGFATDTKYFGSDYRGDFPMTWTVAPSMVDLAPQIMNYLYKNGTNNDCFVAGPSGVGYINATEFNKDSLALYSQLTASYMKEADLEYVNLLDNTIDKSALEELAKYDQIKGGVWSVGNMYIEGNGGVYWVNDKPFVTMRETLWRIAGDDDSNAYYGFVERVAQRINEYKIDPTSIEGYTVVVAHAWSIGSMDYINRFVQALDEDVKLVTVDQLLTLISENVPHKDKEYLDDISKEDIDELVPVSSEQYVTQNIDALEIDRNRTFVFDNGINRNYLWQFGNGGLQYDFSGYDNEGIKLDGSDLEDVIDPMPNAWMVNKFTFDENDKWLTVFASCSSDADVNYRVRAVWVENGRVQSKLLDCAAYETVNDYGWYKMTSASSLVYSYDISEFAGKTVSISVEQDDTGDGSGEVVHISRIVIGENLASSESITDWSISDIATYWTKSGEVTRHKEGICLEGENASISHDILINGKTLRISMRKFQRPTHEQQDITGTVYLKIDGQIVRPKGGLVDYLEVGNTQENFYYEFDVSAFNDGKLHHVEIVSVKAGDKVGDHICISHIQTGSVYQENKCYILFIGNSHTYYNNMPEDIFASIAKNAGYDDVVVKSITQGGACLADFLNPSHGKYGLVDEEIASGAYDYIVLQERLLDPYLNYSGYLDSAKRFAEKIKAANPDTKIVLYQVWGGAEGNPKLDGLDLTDPAELNRYIAAATGKVAEILNKDYISTSVAYSGLAFLEALESDPGLKLYDNDGYHPSEMGSYLSALTIFGTIFGEDPTTVTWSNISDPALEAILKNAAKTAVFDTPVLDDKYYSKTEQ